MGAQDQIMFFYWIRLWGGVGFLVGLVMYLSSFFIGGEPMSGSWYENRRGGVMPGVAQRKLGEH